MHCPAGLGASSPAGPSVSSPVPVHELAHCLGTRPPWLGGREGSQVGTGWHLGCGRSPLSGWPQTPWSLAKLDFRKCHRDPRPLRLRTRLGCAPLRNFGSKSQGAQWDAWVGRAPMGPDADTQLQIQQILLCTAVEPLKQCPWW